MAIIENTQLGATKNALITALVQKELKFAAKLAAVCTDYSALAAPGTKSFALPKLTSFTASKRVEGGAVSQSFITATNDVLALDQIGYVSWQSDTATLLQTAISNFEIKALELAAKALGRQVDADLLAAIIAAADQDLALVTITKDGILDAKEILETSDADMNAVVLVVAPDQMKALLKIDQFTNNQVYGAPAYMTGQIGMVYGVPVIMHNGLSAGQKFMIEKSAMAYAFQQAPALDEVKDLTYGVGGMKKLIEQHYGIKAMQTEVHGAAVGKTKLIVKI